MNHPKSSRLPSLTSLDVRTQHSCPGRNRKMGAEHVPTDTQPHPMQKSLCNPLLSSQERIQSPGTLTLAAENQQQGSGLFSAVSSPYLIYSPKQKLPGRGWEGTAGCPCCQGSPDVACLLNSSFLCHSWKFSQTRNVSQLKRTSSSSPALLPGAAAQSRAGFCPPGDGHLQVSVSKDSFSAEGQRAAGFSQRGAGSGISKE